MSGDPASTLGRHHTSRVVFMQDTELSDDGIVSELSTQRLQAPEVRVRVSQIVSGGMTKVHSSMRRLGSKLGIADVNAVAKVILSYRALVCQRKREVDRAQYLSA